MANSCISVCYVHLPTSTLTFYLIKQTGIPSPLYPLCPPHPVHFCFFQRIQYLLKYYKCIQLLSISLPLGYKDYESEFFDSFIHLGSYQHLKQWLACNKWQINICLILRTAFEKKNTQVKVETTLVNRFEIQFKNLKPKTISNT